MNRRIVIAGGILLVLAAAIAVGYLWWLDYDNEVSREAAVPTVEAEAGQRVYAIDKSASEVRFFLQEDLAGVRTDVIGATSDVAGNIVVDFQNPDESFVSMVEVNARTLETDRSQRNAQIHRNILNTGTYEFITFVPSAIQNFPDNPQIGDELAFQIIGDLTIKDVTREVVFDALVTLVDDNQMTGTASTQVQYDDFNISIPNVRSVANVTDEVMLTIDFVALATDDATNDIASTE